MTTYVTFGSGHTHTINGQVFDTNCLAVFDSLSAEEGRDKAFFYFSKQFCVEYFNKLPDMEWFPRGLIRVEDVKIELNAELKQKVLLVSKVTQMNVNRHINRALQMYLIIGQLPTHDQTRIIKMIETLKKD